MDAATPLNTPPNAPPMTDALQALRDIHTPPPPSWWPPAIGWWIVVVLLVLALALAANYLLRQRRRRAPYRQALRELRELPQRLGSAAPATLLLQHDAQVTAVRHADAIANILRRVTLMRAPHTAHLPLVEALQRCGPPPAKALQRALAQRFTREQPDTAHDEPELLRTQATQWLRAVQRQ